MNWQRQVNKRFNEAGFTLLEVMIALAIIMISFTAILAIQSNSINSSIRTKQNHVASMLLKQIAIKTEYEVEGKSFQEIGTEKSGQFEAPYQDYSWKREIKKVNFPNIASLANAGAPKESQGNSAQGTSNAADQLGQIVTKYLKTALRQIIVTVSWKRPGGEGELSESVTLYWVDYNTPMSMTPGGSDD